MTDIQWRRLDEIESWKQKAFILSRTDRLGRLISKTFDLIQSVVRDGPNAKTLILEVELLREEQLNAIKTDPDQEDIFRSLFYGLSSSFGSMIESIKERNVEMECAFQVNGFDQGDANNENHLHDGDQCFFPEASAKIELLVSLQDLSEVDVKPLNLFDVDSEEQQDDNVMDIILNESVKIDHVSTEVSSETKETEAAEIAQPIRKRHRASVITTSNTGEEMVTTPKADRSGYCATRKDTARKSLNGKCAAGKFGCNKCERTFGTPGWLKRHHTTFHEGFQCGECDIRKKNLDNLLKHYAEYHPGKVPKQTESIAFSSLKCSHCEYEAKSYSKLKLHVNTHTGEKPFTCSDCPAKFAHKCNLKEHIRRLHAIKK